MSDSCVRGKLMPLIPSEKTMTGRGTCVILRKNLVLMKSEWW